MKKASAKRSTPPSGAAKGTGRRTATGAAIPASAARRKRKATAEGDEIAPEYDFRGARPNPYAARYAAGATAVVLDPDVAAAFPSAARVNEVLRAVAGILQPPPPVKRGRSRRSA
jgi:hypothetical protein